MDEQTLSGERGQGLTLRLLPGEYALVATIHDEFRLFTPGFDLSDTKKYLSKSAIALIYVSEKLSDDRWLEEIISQSIDRTENGGA